MNSRLEPGQSMSSLEQIQKVWDTVCYRLKATTYFTLPQYEPSGEKTLQWADALLRRKETGLYIRECGNCKLKTSSDSKLNFSAPMYRPNVVDTLPDAFDLQEIQFVFPKRLSDDYSEDGKTPQIIGLAEQIRFLESA